MLWLWLIRKFLLTKVTIYKLQFLSFLFKLVLCLELNPDGAELYLEFVLKMCCKQSLPKNTDVTPDDLLEIQTSADTSLYVLTTSLPELDQTLWQLLLKCFLGNNYEDATAILLRCLTYLASKRDIPPSCEEAFVKCMILLSSPLMSMRGTFILNFLRKVAPCDVSSYKTVWDVKLPQLGKYLDQNYDGFNSIEWQDQLFDFISLLLGNVENGAFNEILLAKAQRQLELYNHTNR